MLALNLLSPEEKIYSNLQWNYIIIKNVILMVLIVSFVISFILFSAKVVLLTKLQEAEAQTQLVDTARVGTNKNVTEINKTLSYIQTAQQSFTPWSTPIWYFFQHIPYGITLNNININTNESSIQLDGTANSRDDLLNFKTNLESLDFIKELYLPLNSLLQKTDIKFTMNIKLDLDKLELYQ